MTLKKRIARILIEEVMVDLDESAQELHMVVHWHGPFRRPISQISTPTS